MVLFVASVCWRFIARSCIVCASHSVLASAALWLVVCWWSRARLHIWIVLARMCASTRQQRLAMSHRCQQPVSLYVCCIWISGCVCLWLAALILQLLCFSALVYQKASDVSRGALLAPAACSCACGWYAGVFSGCCHHMRTRSCWCAAHLSFAALFAMFVCLVCFVFTGRLCVHCYTGCTIRALV
jgi:hypothetical protein